MFISNLLINIYNDYADKMNGSIELLNAFLFSLKKIFLSPLIIALHLTAGLLVGAIMFFLTDYLLPIIQKHKNLSKKTPR